MSQGTVHVATQFYKKLYTSKIALSNTRKEELEIRLDGEEVEMPSFLEVEVEHALDWLNMGKTAGPEKFEKILVRIVNSPDFCRLLECKLYLRFSQESKEMYNFLRSYTWTRNFLLEE